MKHLKWAWQYGMDLLDSDSDHFKRIHQLDLWTIKKELTKIIKPRSSDFNLNVFKDFLLDFGSQTSVTRRFPQMPISTMVSYSKTKPCTEKLGNIGRKTATTIALDVVSKEIGDHHALWDKNQNLDDSNLRGKTDLNSLNFLFKFEIENKEVRHNNEFEEFESYLSVKGSLKSHFSLWENIIKAN